MLPLQDMFQREGTIIKSKQPIALRAWLLKLLVKTKPTSIYIQYKLQLASSHQLYTVSIRSFKLPPHATLTVLLYPGVFYSD